MVYVEGWSTLTAPLRGNHSRLPPSLPANNDEYCCIPRFGEMKVVEDRGETYPPYTLSRDALSSFL